MVLLVPLVRQMSLTSSVCVLVRQHLQEPQPSTAHTAGRRSHSRDRSRRTHGNGRRALRSVRESSDEEEEEEEIRFHSSAIDFSDSDTESGGDEEPAAASADPFVSMENTVYDIRIKRIDDTADGAEQQPRFADTSARLAARRRDDSADYSSDNHFAELGQQLAGAQRSGGFRTDSHDYSLLSEISTVFDGAIVNCFMLSIIGPQFSSNSIPCVLQTWTSPLRRRWRRSPRRTPRSCTTRTSR